MSKCPRCNEILHYEPLNLGMGELQGSPECLNCDWSPDMAVSDHCSHGPFQRHQWSLNNETMCEHCLKFRSSSTDVNGLEDKDYGENN